MPAIDYTGKSVLVTGADGFIGSHLVERLSALGAQVTALSLYDAFDTHGWLDELDAAVRERVSMVRGDVRDGAFVMRLVRGHDMVFHLAALIAIPYSYETARSYVDVNTLGTLNVLEAAREHDVERLVHTSTSEVYGTAQYEPIDEKHPLRAQSPYAASKIAADTMVEAYARSFGIRAVVLRPFNTYGPRQSERAVLPTIVRQALDPDRPTIALGDTSPRRDFTFVYDTVEAFASVGVADGIEFGIPYNTGSGVAVTIAELVDKVRRLTNADKPIETEPARFRPEHSEVRALIADASRLASITGWTPEISLDEGLGRTIEWWRGRVAAGRVRRSAAYII